MSAEKLADILCSNLYYALQQWLPLSRTSGGMPRQLFAMIVIHGSKGWDSRGEAFAKVAIR